jgi:hypothetical protein
LPVIVGFIIGCGFGAAWQAAAGLWSLALPTGLALFAFAMGWADKKPPRGTFLTDDRHAPP